MAQVIKRSHNPIIAMAQVIRRSHNPEEQSLQWHKSSKDHIIQSLQWQKSSKDHITQKSNHAMAQVIRRSHNPIIAMAQVIRRSHNPIIAKAQFIRRSHNPTIAMAQVIRRSHNPEEQSLQWHKSFLIYSTYKSRGEQTHPYVNISPNHLTIEHVNTHFALEYKLPSHLINVASLSILKSCAHARMQRVVKLFQPVRCHTSQLACSPPWGKAEPHNAWTTSTLHAHTKHACTTGRLHAHTKRVYHWYAACAHKTRVDRWYVACAHKTRVRSLLLRSNYLCKCACTMRALWQKHAVLLQRTRHYTSHIHYT